MAHLEEARSEPLCLHTNASTTGFRQLLGWGTHPCAKRMVYPNSTGTEASILRTLLDLFIRLFICILCHILYNKPVHRSVSLSSVTHSSKSSNPRRRSWEPLVYSWLARSMGGLDLQWASDVGAVLWDWVPEPVGSDGNSRSRVSELTCIVGQENWWVWEKYPHIWCQKCWLE